MLSTARALRYEPKGVLSYQSPQGQTVTSLRGMTLQSTMKLLQSTPDFARYEALLRPEHRESLRLTLAASWLSAELVEAHFRAMDGLELSTAQLTLLGEQLGAYIVDSSFASMLRSARALGAEAGIWLCLKQADRIWNRVYQGGGFSLTQIGPKDAVLDVHGLPFARSRCFRVMHAAFMRGLVLLIARVCLVKPTAGREARSDSFAVSISWV